MEKIELKDIPTIVVLLACDDFHSEKDASIIPCDRIMKASGVTEYLAIQALQRELDAGNLEKGIDIKTAWLSAKGRSLIQNI